MATRTEIIELYIGYYDRAPDAEGLAFWEASELTTDQMTASFAEQDETAAKYPDTMSTAEYVNQIYVNVFNRPADPNGLAYWTTSLDDGLVTRANMIVSVLNGAQGDDQKVLDNKVAVGEDFAVHGLTDYTNSVEIMDTVTADEATVTAAADQIVLLATNDYTTERDIIEGTDLDDTFFGTVTGAASTTTFQGQDYADGGEGVDTLKITASVAATTTTTAQASSVDNMEVLHLVQEGTGAIVIDATNFNVGIDKIVAEAGAGGTGNITLGASAGATSGLQSVAKTVDLDILNATSELTLNYYAGAVVGTADTTDLNLNATAGINTLTSNGIEKYKVHTVDGHSQVLTIDDDQLAPTTGSDTGIVIDGGGNLQLNLGTPTNVIDASTATGNLTFGTGPVLANGGNMTLGSGNDIVAAANLAGAATVNGGAGNDQIEGSNAVSTLMGGAGNDTITSGVAGSTLVGGAGADTITMIDGDILRYDAQSESTSSARDTVTNTTISTTTTVDVTEAIRVAGGTITGAALDANNATVSNLFIATSAALGEGEAFITAANNGVAGVTHAYMDTATTALYIDINQDNVFHAADDIVINIAAVVAGNIIV